MTTFPTDADRVRAQALYDTADLTDSERAICAIIVLAARTSAAVQVATLCRFRVLCGVTEVGQ